MADISDCGTSVQFSGILQYLDDTETKYVLCVSLLGCVCLLIESEGKPFTLTDLYFNALHDTTPHRMQVKGEMTKKKNQITNGWVSET